MDEWLIKQTMVYPYYLTLISKFKKTKINKWKNLDESQEKWFK